MYAILWVITVPCGIAVGVPLGVALLVGSSGEKSDYDTPLLDDFEKSRQKNPKNQSPDGANG